MGRPVQNFFKAEIIFSFQLGGMTTDEEDGEGGGGNDSDSAAEMEYCDPCYCYGKCCLDIVASIFCVSLL